MDTNAVLAIASTAIPWVFAAGTVYQRLRRLEKKMDNGITHSIRHNARAIRALPCIRERR